MAPQELPRPLYGLRVLELAGIGPVPLAAFARRAQREWTGLAASNDACVAPVHSLRTAAAHPHLAARRTLTEVDGRIVAASASRFSRSASPAIGTR